MKVNRNQMLAPVIAMAIVAAGSLANAAIINPVTGWAVHNGSSTVTNGGTNSPTFTAADNITVMGTFPDVELADDGDYVTVSTTLTVATRTTNLSANSLNTQLRLGLFEGPAGAVVGPPTPDTPNLGIIIEYTNDAPAAASRRLIREQTSSVQTNPFTSPINIGNGGADTGNDSIQGANIGPVLFTLTLTKMGGNLDITGQISGTDSVSGNPYQSNFSLLGYTPAAVGSNFNRVGFFFGGNVDGTDGGTLNNVTITTNVPEPSSCLLAAVITMTGVTISRQVQRATRRVA